MSTERYALRGRRVATPTGLRAALVVIENGVIERIFDGAQDGGAEISDCPVLDAGDRILMPGGIDPHVHLNDPGRASWEGFDTGTRAAKAGGLTLVVDMPLNSDPVTTTVRALELKRRAAAGRCHVPVSFYGGLVPGNFDQLEPMIDSGVVGIKAFLADSGLDDFPAVGEQELLPAMKLLARRGLPLLAHAEITDPAGEATSGDPRRYETWLASRPVRYELAAIDLLLRLCERTGCHVHIVHLACADALPRLRHARAAGLPVTVETCPHYLTFAAEQIPDGDPRFKCAPPIREAHHREELWRALADGTLDLVASDHSPCPPERRGLTPGIELGEVDLTAAWGGISSLQLSMAATWTAARARGHDVMDLVRWMSTAPARLLGVGNRKGQIAPGFDADLVLFDPDYEWVVRGAELEHRHAPTPYEGRALSGAFDVVQPPV